MKTAVYLSVIMETELYNVNTYDERNQKRKVPSNRSIYKLFLTITFPSLYFLMLQYF